MPTEFKVNKFLFRSTAFVCLIFIAYAILIVCLVWPISEFSIAKAGTFGDSFGVLTSLFTGLAFAGLLSTIFLQREDIKLNRSELIETRKEIQLQSQTFHRQRFEDAFYQMLALYKENLRELSIRPHDADTHRISGIEAIQFLIKKFEKAWGKHNFHKFPVKDNERDEYLYELLSTIKSVFTRQTRYVETLSSILVLIDEECTPPDRKEMYWRTLASQLTTYEIKYLFYQALVAPDFQSLRNMMTQSKVFQNRLSTISIPDAHRQCFEIIWQITLPPRKNTYAPLMTKSQIKSARRQKQMRQQISHLTKKATETELRESEADSQ